MILLADNKIRTEPFVVAAKLSTSFRQRMVQVLTGSYAIPTEVFVLALSSSRYVYVKITKRLD